MILIDRVIGSGEIAISDHRSSQPTVQELARIASEARIGGMLSGKAGIVNIHVGDGKDGLTLIQRVVETTDIPVSQFLPTHINRNPALFEQGINYAKNGGYVDFTTSTIPTFIEDGEVPAAHAVRLMADKGVPLENITMTSDAQGSLPAFNREGELTGLTVAPIRSLFEAFLQLVQEENFTLEQAIQIVSTNPARILKFKSKGRLMPGADADLLLLEPRELTLKDVFSKGQRLMADEKITVWGTFE